MRFPIWISEHHARAPVPELRPSGLARDVDDVPNTLLEMRIWLSCAGVQSQWSGRTAGWLRVTVQCGVRDGIETPYRRVRLTAWRENACDASREGRCCARGACQVYASYRNPVSCFNRLWYAALHAPESSSCQPNFLSCHCRLPRLLFLNEACPTFRSCNAITDTSEVNVRRV